MKTLIASLILVSASTSLACPELTGKFNCSATNGPTIQVELQNLADGKIKLEDSVVTASEDGVSEFTEGLGFKIETIGTCRGDQVLEVVQLTRNAETGALLNVSKKTYNKFQDNLIEIWVKASEAEKETLIRCHRRF